MRARGFTLLEVMIAMAILAVSLVAISEIDAGAIAMHAYAKRLTVATFLAKSKMLDIESKLYAEGLPAEGDDVSPSDGDFDDEGFPEYKWKVEVVAPKSEDLDPTKLIGMILGGGDASGDDSSGSSSSPSSSSGPLGAGGGLASMLGGLMGTSSSGGDSSGGPTASGLGAMAQTALAGPAQMMVTQITQMVREVRLTVSWRDGKVPQSFTVVEHVVSMGQGQGQTPPQPKLPGMP